MKLETLESNRIYTTSRLLSHISLPIYLERVPAGFPSPADDFLDKGIDLNEILIRHPSATYFVRAQGESMKGIGIYDDTLLIIDNALTVKNKDIVLAIVNGEFTVKEYNKTKNCVQLNSHNPKFPPFYVRQDMDFEVRGVVSSWINTCLKIW